MLEQVWKNVAGTVFPFKVEGDAVVVTIPQGSDVKIYKFSQYLNKVEEALGNNVICFGRLNEEGQMVFKIVSVPEDTEETAEQPAKEETASETEEPVEVPAKKGRKKKVD